MTVSPEEFILKHGDILLHEYDPAKAHEYYLRTRQLKGREKGDAQPPSSLAVRRAASKRRHREAQARVDALKDRLDKLRDVLRELTKQAKARSGVDSKDKDSKKAKSAGSKKLTAAQKREAAKRSKEYREKHKKELEKESISDKEKRLQEEIQEINAKIAKARKDLKAAIARAKKRATDKNPAAA